MSSTWRNRRKPKVIGNDHDELDTGRSSNKRPKISKSKPRLNLISQFDEETSKATGGNESEVVITKKHGLGRKILDQNASVRVDQEQDRPSYTNEYLKELEESTLSTPKRAPDISTRTDENDDMAIDVASTFGQPVQLSAPSVIPSEAEIREKKARRARLALEQNSKQEDYISLNDAGEEYNENEKWDLAVRSEPLPNSRLVHDDEDFAEGFDEFVQDGAIALGKKAEREQSKKERQAMRELIEEQDSDGVDSDFEEKAAYDAAQARAGRYNEAPGVIMKVEEGLPPLVDIPPFSEWLKSTRAKEAQEKKEQTDLRRKRMDLGKTDTENVNAISEIVDRMTDTQIDFTRLFQFQDGLSCQSVLKDHMARHPERFPEELRTALRKASKGYMDVSRENSECGDGDEVYQKQLMEHQISEFGGGEAEKSD
ncbi:hypothetical protein N7495_004638 [Penicillium taxi]|uniref:uncharacterized protein n=1 Tax=Penicillium taxi TaxID=168475 RepID=UPI0025459E47|nr:uncharacterized protein N7495_004638 [Penicillium taxi]KAJ5899894.1 hypothetical protein N7495_004638 [Penicillium taxi]